MNEKQVRFEIGKSYTHDSFASENSDFVRKAYRKIVEINKKLFQQVPYKVVFTENDTYSSAKEMRERVQKEGVIYIYKGGEPNQYMTSEENWIGHAVHDVFAHLVCGCPFNFIGEYNAYLEQRKHYPEWTWRVLFAEIPAQTSAYYYNGNFNYNQRAIEAPVEWLEMCEQFKKDYSHNSILSVEKLLNNCTQIAL